MVRDGARQHRRAAREVDNFNGVLLGQTYARTANGQPTSCPPAKEALRGLIRLAQSRNPRWSPVQGTHSCKPSAAKCVLGQARVKTISHQPLATAASAASEPRVSKQ